METWHLSARLSAKAKAQAEEIKQLKGKGAGYGKKVWEPAMPAGLRGKASKRAMSSPLSAPSRSPATESAPSA